MCLANGQPCLVYGDIGAGKTTFIDKLMTNKYDFVRLSNTEPNNLVYETLLAHTPLCQRKKNGNKRNLIYFIDDLNLTYKCSLSKTKNSRAVSANLELARQILDTHYMYSPAEENFMSMADVNLILSCAYPDKSPNYVALKQSLSKSLVCVHLNQSEKSLVESVFMAPVQYWLEEFPPYLVRYPIEIAKVNKHTIKKPWK